jgi:hypothetical protein
MNFLEFILLLPFKALWLLTKTILSIGLFIYATMVLLGILFVLSFVFHAFLF